ncbi:MAG: glycosyltransferase [Chloroflexota bacterium]
MTESNQKKTIVFVAADSWHSLLRAPQHLVTRLTKEFNIIFLEPGRAPEDNQAQKAVSGLKSIFKVESYSPMENLTVVPGIPNIPVFRTQFPKWLLKLTYPVTSRINFSYNIRHYKRALKQLDVKDPIVLLWGFGDYGMDAHRFFDHIENALSCYLVYDESPDFAHNKRIQAQLRAADDLTCKKADVVMATSKSQLDRRLHLNDNVVFMPNGVDFAMFNSPFEKGVEVPADIIDLPKPIIGFSGWMGYQIDVPLLLHTSKQFPEASIVLLGPNTIPNSPELDDLMQMPNVHFLGKKDPNELASYFQVFDAAIIPYILKGHVRYIYPLKLHEYLATGRAVVSTDLPNLYPHEDILRIAKTRDEFVEHIRAAFNDQSPEMVRARIDEAKKYSWDDRAADITRIFNQSLQIA